MLRLYQPFVLLNSKAFSMVQRRNHRRLSSRRSPTLSSTRQTRPLCVVDLLRSICSGLPLDESQAHQVLTSVATMTTSVEVLSNLASMHALRTHARSMQTRIALATSKKGAQIEYYSKMHGYIVMMATSGHPLRDEEFVSYLLAGLDEDLYPHGLYRGGSCWSGESQRPCGNHPKWLSSRHIEGFITCRTVNESQGQKLCLKGTKAKLNYRPNK